MKLAWRRVRRPPPRLTRKGCKPDSVFDSHLSERPNPRLQRHGPRHRRLFGLAPDGVFRAVGIAADAVSSYLAVSPLPRHCCRGGFLSVALSVAPALRRNAP